MPANLSILPRAGRSLTLPAPIARLQQASGLVVSRGIALAAQVGVQMAVGALSGPIGLGVLQLFTAWSNILGEILSRGWPSIVLKQVSVAWSNGEKRCGRAALNQARSAVLRGCAWGLVAAVAIMIIGRPASDQISGPESAVFAFVLFLGAVLFAWTRLNAEALKGADSPLTAVTLESLALPSVLLLACLACVLFGIALSPMILVLGGLLGLVVGAAWLGRAVQSKLGTHAPVPGSIPNAVDNRERRALWYSGVQAIVFLQLPFIVFPWFTDTATIGIYAVAHKLINVITTLLILLGSVYGPAFARAGAQRDPDLLRKLLAKTQGISLIVFVPSAAVLLMTTDLLAGLFHVPAGDLHLFMAILVAGQLINAATGLSGILLNLTGAARTEWLISLFTLGAAFIASVPIGMYFGASGLAVLFSIVLALKNLASWLAARRHLTQGEFAQ